MGQTLKEFSHPTAWEFSHEQIQNPAEVGKYLEEKCHADSNEKKLIATNWPLAYACHTLPDTAGQQMEAGGQQDKSAATPGTQAAASTQLLRVELNQTVSLRHWQSLQEKRERSTHAKLGRNTNYVVVSCLPKLCQI